MAEPNRYIIFLFSFSQARTTPIEAAMTAAKPDASEVNASEKAATLYAVKVGPLSIFQLT